MTKQKRVDVRDEQVLGCGDLGSAISRSAEPGRDYPPSVEGTAPDTAQRELVAERLFPPDWFDGNPKPCPGQAVVRYNGVMVETEQGLERIYLSRCSHCDKPLPPTLPSEPHTFIPLPPNAELAFIGGSKILIGVQNEPTASWGPWVAVLNGIADWSVTWHATRMSIQLGGLSRVVSPKMILTLCGRAVPCYQISRTSRLPPAIYDQNRFCESCSPGDSPVPRQD